MGLKFALEDAQKDYKTEWDSNVKRLGRTDGTLPGSVADSIDKHYKNAKDEAYRRWGK